MHKTTNTPHISDLVASPTPSTPTLYEYQTHTFDMKYENDEF